MNNEVIDMHVHFGCPENDKNNCYWSKDFEKTIAYYAMLIITKSIFKKVTYEHIYDSTMKTIGKSKNVAKVVILGLDQVYDESGNPHREWTHLHTPNDFVMDLAEKNNRILFGASIHPYRSDWEAEMDKCLEHKAVLCKWIPSSMLIDPTSDKCIPFYNKLAKHNLPLLCHAGPEYAIPTSKPEYDEYNNPKYLKPALDQGVTVIIAHCATPYFWIFDKKYHDDYEEFLSLFKESETKGWKLYADISAFASILRKTYIQELTKKIPSEKLVYGSDYPVPISEISHDKSRNIFRNIINIVKASMIKNPLDKYSYLVKNMGSDKKVFFNMGNLISEIKYQN